jgi:HTH-type transcriptional regulator/antitoxin HigA
MMITSRNFIATPPGATIKEQLNDRAMSQKEFSSRMEMSEKHISRLINGEVRLTSDVAIRLEMVLGLPAHFWNNLESIYREKINKAKAENEMDSDIEILKKFPYKEMSKNGWVPDVKNSEDRVLNLRKFFEVVHLGLVKENLIPGIICRRQAITEKADYALIAWAQKAKLESRKITTLPIDLKALANNMEYIRTMTILDPGEFCPKLINLLADCGIAVIFLPHIGGSFLHGATFYNMNKIIIGLTVRGKDADKFWFSFFHEIGHILLGHNNKGNGTTEEDEKAADGFARDTFLTPELFKMFISNGIYSKESIKTFAGSINIHTGIVVGRLQNEGLIPYNRHNDLKIRYGVLP